MFLSGYDDIVTLREKIAAEEKKLTEVCKYTLYTLHSNMQVSVTCCMSMHWLIMLCKVPTKCTKFYCLPSNIYMF